MTDITTLNIPETIPVHTLKDMVAFPYMVVALFLKEEEIAAFEESIAYNNLVALVKTRPEGGEGLDGLCTIGTLCKVNKLIRLSEGGAKATVEGLCRISLERITAEKPFLLAAVEPIREFTEKTMVSEALVSSLNALLKIALSYGRPLPDDVMKMLDYIDNPARLADLVTLYINLPVDEQQ
ncbi:MAG TPA: LON peptidase substrate-binding domain-containing protein, partial [Desulfurivibrionaceae bacterium]|nr:LON peptidase substrate-binding domain-containing protein [Desulfurivibrionaceae bacterium]